MSAAERVVTAEMANLQAQLAAAVQAGQWNKAEDTILEMLHLVKATIGIIHSRTLRSNATRLGISLDDEQHPTREEKL